jgi:MFS family permease
MVSGRLTVDRIVEIKGRLPVIQIGSAVAVAAVVLLMFSPDQWLSLFGWFVMGIGLSGVVPQIFAMSGEIGEATHAGRNMAKVVGISYLGALIGPSVIGILTIWLPLNLALVWALFLAVFVTVISPKLERLGK